MVALFDIFGNFEFFVSPAGINGILSINTTATLPIYWLIAIIYAIFLFIGLFLGWIILKLSIASSSAINSLSMGLLIVVTVNFLFQLL